MKMDPLLVLPDDTLLEEILPELPLDALTNFCTTNKRINALCEEDVIWAERIKREYPAMFSSKPPKSTWYDYYFTISPYRVIPIWSNKSIIGEEEFHVANELPSISILQRFLPAHPDFVLIYTTKGLNPVFSAIYRNGELVESRHYKDSLDKIARVIFSDDPNVVEAFRDRPIEEPEVYGRKPDLQQVIQKREGELRHVIQSQLLLIYEMTEPGNGSQTWLRIMPDAFADEPMETTQNLTRHPRGKPCLQFQRGELIDLMYKLGIPSPPSEHRPAISTMTMHRHIERAVPTQEITPEIIEYHQAWQAQSRYDICQILKNALIDVTDDGPFL